MTTFVEPKRKAYNAFYNVEDDYISTDEFRRTLSVFGFVIPEKEIQALVRE